MASLWDDFAGIFTPAYAKPESIKIYHTDYNVQADGPNCSARLPLSGDPVDEPTHYKSGGLEAIDVIRAFFADKYFRGSVFKYLARAGKKDSAKELEDLLKARRYLDWEIARVERIDR